jgi:hypothetical protein
MVTNALIALFIRAVEALVLVLVNIFRVRVDDIVIVWVLVARLAPKLSLSESIFANELAGEGAAISLTQKELVQVCPLDATICVVVSNLI